MVLVVTLPLSQALFLTSGMADRKRRGPHQHVGTYDQSPRPQKRQSYYTQDQVTLILLSFYFQSVPTITRLLYLFGFGSAPTVM